ncbi:MAG: hypothetical protein ACQSGP_25060 [Frankia sp.]
MTRPERPDIAVRAVGGRRFEVTTSAGVHMVTADDDVLGALGWTDPSTADLERLVAGSFRFLLAREPAGSILTRFDLSVIETYFPGYLRDIRAGFG